MLVYHGTTEAIARDALDWGLLPRCDSGSEGNWEDCPSNSELIYLTVAYAPYFASAATGEGKHWGIVEIDTDQLEEGDLLPDEDFLEQATRMSDNKFTPPGVTSMEDRTKWFRDNLYSFRHHWKDSVEGIGNLAHYGEIPAEAVRRVAIYDPRSNPDVTLAALDPSISIINYKLVGGTKYRELTKWFMGESISIENYMGFAFAMTTPEHLAGVEGALANREGLEVILNPNYLG